MSTGSPGHTHHEVEDEARHAWALGNVRIQRMLEQLKALAQLRGGIRLRSREVGVDPIPAVCEELS